MREHADTLTAAGAGIAAIGTGGHRYATAFKHEQELDLPLLVDTDLDSYREVGARQGAVVGLLSPKVLTQGARSLARGRRQGRAGPHPMLLGATHVLTPDGDVPFAWINEDVADSAPIPEVLTSLPSAP